MRLSVPKDARSEGKLVVIERAKGLAAYTLQITKNTAIFDPAQNEGFIDEIRRLAIEIFSMAWTANNIYVRTQRDAEERARLQTSARINCNKLLPMIELAGKVFHLKTKRLKYWGAWVVEVRTRLQQWQDADRKRYANMDNR